jgi:hypothetical protein
MAAYLIFGKGYVYKMEDNSIRFGKLVVDYEVDENSYRCTCDCGMKIIVKREHLNENSHCGCVTRALLLDHIRKNSNIDIDDDIVENKVPVPDNNKGRGLNFDKKKNKWRARIIYQSKEYHLGYFQDEKTALEVRKDAEMNMGTGFLEWYNKLKNDSIE